MSKALKAILNSFVKGMIYKLVPMFNTNLHTSNIHMKETNTICGIYKTYIIGLVIKEAEMMRSERYVHRSSSLIPNVSADNGKNLSLAGITSTYQFPPFNHDDKTVKK